MSAVIESRCQVSEETFEGLTMEGGEVAGSEFRECSFVRCALREVAFRACAFDDCSFVECDLSLVKLPHSTFAACRLDDCKIIGVNWTEARWPKARLWEPVRFHRCVLDHSTFMGLGMKGIRMTRCTAKDVDFRETDLSGADFSGTELSGSLFASTDLTEADLSGASGYSIDPAVNKLKGAKFSLPEALALLSGLGIELTGWEPQE